MFFSSVQFSHSVVSDSLRPHESQPPCPSPTPRVHSDSHPLSQWCHPAISSSVVPFSSFAQSPPASESSPKSQLFAWGGQSTGVSASASVLPMNTQDWSPLGWTGWTSLQSKGLSRVFSNTTAQASICWCSGFFIIQLSHPYMTTRKTTAFTIRTFVDKVMSLLFNMLSRCHCFSSKEQASFNFMAAVTIHSIFGVPQNRSVTVSIVSPSICHKVMGLDAVILIFWILSIKPAFFILLFRLHQEGLIPLQFLP